MFFEQNGHVQNNIKHVVLLEYFFTISKFLSINILYLKPFSIMARYYALLDSVCLYNETITHYI